MAPRLSFVDRYGRATAETPCMDLSTVPRGFLGYCRNTVAPYVRKMPNTLFVFPGRLSHIV